MSRHRRRIVPCALVAGLAGCGSLAGLAADSTTSVPVIQMLADVTLIDQECRNVTVVFGKALQAGETEGVHVGDVMPVGRLRPVFEAAYKLRFTATSHDDLCGSLVDRYAAEIPGLFTHP